MCVSAPISSYAAKYEVVTSTKAMVARDTLQGIDMSSISNSGGASTEMYTADRMNAIVENTDLVSVVKIRISASSPPILKIEQDL